jgi:hypothetical protein
MQQPDFSPELLCEDRCEAKKVFITWLQVHCHKNVFHGCSFFSARHNPCAGCFKENEKKCNFHIVDGEILLFSCLEQSL